MGQVSHWERTGGKLGKFSLYRLVMLGKLPYTAQQLLILVALFLLLCFQSCSLVKIPKVDTYQKMPSRTVMQGSGTNELQKELQDLSLLRVFRKKREIPFLHFVEESNSNAFLILQNNQIIFEWYADTFKEDQEHASFSVAKSILSALIGIAIEEGKIKSTEDEVLKYLPNLDSSEFEGMQIEHLLQMTSGIRYSEMDVFYSTDVTSIFEELKPKFKVETKHEYWSTSYQLLGMVLEKAIQPQLLSEYLSEKIWVPMGAEFKASWTIDHEGGTEKTFCCIQAKARDYARFGLIYLNNGYYNDRQIVPKTWITTSITMNEKAGSVKKYNYGWWFPSEEINEYMARGFKGQYIFVNQEKRTVIIRLGKNRDGLYRFKWGKLLSEINKQL